MTRITVGERKESAKGTRLALDLSNEKLDELSRKGEADAGRGVPAREPVCEGEGREKAIARRSSFSRP